MQSSRKSPSIVIVGAGFAGICMAIRLKQAGIDDFVILERASCAGGVWRDNTYPGVACDVPSHLYSFSFAPNAKWSRFFAPQTEILAYIEACIEKFGLRPHLRLSQGVTGATFNDATRTWHIESQTNGTAPGETFEARVMVLGSGHALTKPTLPAIAGQANFRGHTFHTARWDHTVDLKGLRVGVIGTGASAIQVVPNVAKLAANVTVFQRTAPWILPKPDWRISPHAQSVFALAPSLQTASRRAIYWLLEAFALGYVVNPNLNKLRELQALRFLKNAVHEASTRAALTPHFRMGCKRVLFSDEYYPAFNSGRVALECGAIEGFLETGLRTRSKDGRLREHALDAVVFATGFEASEAKPPFPIVGAKGLSLTEAWSDSLEAYLGTTVAGFPNLFLIEGPNTGLGHSSMIFMIESQVNYILSAVTQLRKASGAGAFSLKPSVQKTYNERLQARLKKTVWATGCESWYLTKGGKNTTLWPGFTFEFRARTARFDASKYDVV